MVRNRPARAAFTLVELLVVIAIIGILAALTTAAVQNVRKKGKELECRNDLTSLDTAIGAFRAKMANTPIPSGGGGPNGTFRLCSDYPPGATAPGTDSWPEVQILMRMFPRMSRTDNGLRAPGTTTQISSAQPVLLDPNQCMVFFLSGGSFTEYLGFASDPFTPFAPPATAAKRITSFFEFPKARMKSPQDYNPTGENPPYANQALANKMRFSGDPLATATPYSAMNEPWFLDPWKHPYLYFASSNGNDYKPDPVTSPAGLEIGPWGGQYSGRAHNRYWSGGPDAIQLWTAIQNPVPLKESATKFMNSKTHQIISMGEDGVIGVSRPPTSGTPVNGLYEPEKSEWIGALAGADDFANFRKSRLGASE